MQYTLCGMHECMHVVYMYVCSLCEHTCVYLWMDMYLCHHTITVHKSPSSSRRLNLNGHA